MKSIVTARLVLRPFSRDDVDVVHTLWTDPDVRRYLWDNVVISRERADEMVRGIIAAFERDGRGMWLIHEKAAEKAADNPCGFCGFLPADEPDVAELIYGLARPVWGRGYATESGRAVIEYGFRTLGLTRITASTDVPNTASARVLDRCAMRFVRRGAVNGLELVFYAIERPTA